MFIVLPASRVGGLLPRLHLELNRHSSDVSGT